MADSLKILHLIDHMGIGGAQRIVAEIKLGEYSSSIFSIRRKEHQETVGTKGVINYSAGYTKLAFIKSYFILNKVIRTEKFDIVHCHLPASFLVGFLLSFKHPSVRFLFHEHGWILKEIKIYLWLLRLVSYRGTIITCSKLLEQEIRKLNGKQKIYVLNNFVDPERFFPNPEKRQDFRKQWNIEENQFVIGFAGRLISDKGWRTLLSAVSMLDDFSFFFIVIAGEGPDKQGIITTAKNLGLEKRVKLVGRERDMPGFYNALDLFVFPTIMEGFGMAHLEALACGVTILISDIEVLRESVNQDACVFFQVGNANQLASQIQRLRDTPALRQKLTAAGFIQVRKYSKEIYEATLKQIYKEVISP